MHPTGMFSCSHYATVMCDYDKYLITQNGVGVDPELGVGGEADPRGGAATYDFAKFSKDLPEI